MMESPLRETTETEVLRRQNTALTGGMADIRHALAKLKMGGVAIDIKPLEALVAPRIREVRARLKELGAAETEVKPA